MDMHFTQVLPELEKTLTETQSFEPLLASLKFLRRLFRSKPFGVQALFLKDTDRIFKLLLGALNHDYSKVVSEALRVTGSFLNTLRAPETAMIGKEHEKLVQPLFQVIIQKL